MGCFPVGDLDFLDSWLRTEDFAAEDLRAEDFGAEDFGTGKLGSILWKSEKMPINAAQLLKS